MIYAGKGPGALTRLPDPVRVNVRLLTASQAPVRSVSGRLIDPGARGGIRRVELVFRLLSEAELRRVLGETGSGEYFLSFDPTGEGAVKVLTLSCAYGVQAPGRYELKISAEEV